MAQVKRIMISLPETLLEQVDLIVREEKRNRSEFIREAMKLYIIEKNKRRLREELKQGYIAMGEINLQLAEEALAGDENCIMGYESVLAEVQ